MFVYNAGISYTAKCQANGYRVEILTKNQIWDVFKPIVLNCCQKTKFSLQYLLLPGSGIRPVVRTIEVARNP